MCKHTHVYSVCMLGFDPVLLLFKTEAQHLALSKASSHLSSTSLSMCV
jgi:hypothetical protein